MTTLLLPEDLSTVHLVPLTPFTPSSEVNLETHSIHIQRLHQQGIEVFLPAAATSGFYQLTANEISSIVKATVEATHGQAKVFAPLGLNLLEAIQIGKQAKEDGATGIMFMPATAPYLSDEGLKAYYIKVMEEVGLPTLIYKKAALPSNNLLLILSDHNQLVGIKYASADIEAFHQVVQQDQGRLAWLCGLAERYANAFMAQGAGGYTSGAGNLAPKTTLALHNALQAGDLKEARRLQEILLPIERYRGRAGDSYNVSMLQYSMRLLDEPLDYGSPRLPMRELTPEEKIEIEETLKPILEFERKL